MKRFAALLISLVLLLTALPGLAESETLRLGMTGEDVLRVQVRLKALGYYFGALDSGYGLATYNAVVAFQTRNAMTATGEADVYTMARLFAADAVPGTFIPPYTLVLRPGDTGTEVSQAQVRLKELGYYQGTIDGVYGYGTYSAVRVFQGRNGLAADGKIGPDTRAKLYSIAAIANAPALISTSFRILAYNSVSPAVTQVQTRLKELGYYTGSLDGKFRSLTYNAVVNFQSTNGLTADGKVGAATWAALFNGALPAVPPAPVSGGLSEGDSGAAVTRAQQVLTALGYYHGPINGVYTIYITQAVRAFQETYGLTASGVLDAATANKMNSVYTPPDPSLISPPAAVLSLGKEGTAVVQAQTRLRELLYYTGLIDGKYGSGTMSAVAAFQAQSGLGATGVLDLETAKKLYALTALQNPLALIPPHTDLKMGSAGVAVIQAQARLSSLGYYSGLIDGSYGLSTYNAVLLFQGRNALAADGKIGDATEARLYALDAVAADTGPDPVPEKNILQLGSLGEEVSFAQAKLKALGYYTGVADGIYGYGTYYAVAAFQGVAGLVKDGKIGDATRAALYAAGAPVMPDGTEVMPPDSSFAVLRPGDEGIAVSQAQTRLSALHYYSGLTDGVYGSGTTAAVIAFQVKNSLLVDGKIGEQTWTKLFAADAIAN